MLILTYYNKKKRQALDREDDAAKVMIINATRGRWKRMRNIMNPTFSTTKLKKVCFYIQCLFLVKNK